MDFSIAELSTSSLGRRKILENTVSGRRERERMKRDSCGKRRMILVIWILGLEQLDFRLEQGGEEGFLEGFWIYVEFH